MQNISTHHEINALQMLKSCSSNNPVIIRPESNIQKFAQNESRNFPKFFTYYVSQCSYYACIMLLSCQQFLALSWKISSNDCSIRVFHFKTTVLLESIDLFQMN